MYKHCEKCKLWNYLYHPKYCHYCIIATNIEKH